MGWKHGACTGISKELESATRRAESNALTRLLVVFASRTFAAYKGDKQAFDRFQAGSRAFDSRRARHFPFTIRDLRFTIGPC
jgi:hypothetical protein